jgi:hypothetical protein
MSGGGVGYGIEVGGDATLAALTPHKMDRVQLGPCPSGFLHRAPAACAARALCSVQTHRLTDDVIEADFHRHPIQ